ncbi:hypothetical protein ACQ1Z2_15175, partial [Enterococcus faecalis]|uniref:hypothetical protein n=1 Tax=Enterococcus faecalis TaxID=1351 RepID=UPI003D6A7576
MAPSEIGDPSIPAAGAAAQVTAGATGRITTCSLADVTLLTLPSESMVVAARPSVKFTSLVALIFRVVSFHVLISTDVLPAVAVN